MEDEICGWWKQWKDTGNLMSCKADYSDNTCCKGCTAHVNVFIDIWVVFNTLSLHHVTGVNSLNVTVCTQLLMQKIHKLLQTLYSAIREVGSEVNIGRRQDKRKVF